MNTILLKGNQIEISNIKFRKSNKRNFSTSCSSKFQLNFSVPFREYNDVILHQVYFSFLRLSDLPTSLVKGYFQYFTKWANILNFSSYINIIYFISAFVIHTFNLTNFVTVKLTILERILRGFRESILYTPAANLKIFLYHNIMCHKSIHFFNIVLILCLVYKL